jgi:hypothetical protein
MSPTGVALLILCVVALLAIAAYAVQIAENRRKALQLKLMQLHGKIRRAEHLLSNYPPLLQNPEITSFLVQYLIKRSETALQLEQTDSIQVIYNAAQERAKAQPQPIAHPEGSVMLFKSPAEAQRARAVIKEFVKFIKEAEASNEISKNLSQPLLKEAKTAFERTEIDLQLAEAIEKESLNDGKHAFLAYKRCFIRLSELNKNHQLDRQMFEIRNRMNTLAAIIEQRAEEERERLRKEHEEEQNDFKG